MLASVITVRVRYGETDQMGYCYYGNYAQYFEIGRTEWLRENGISYKEMELTGIMLPVTDLQIKYLKPAKYDDLLTIKTYVKNKPTAKIEFYYEIFNGEELLTTGTTSLVFINTAKNRPVKAPQYILDQF
jgi:acyl-CoA thioester hydrolase